MRKSIRKFLIIYLALLSITPLIFLSSILSWENYRVNEELVREIQIVMSNVALEKIRNYLDEQRILLISTLKATHINKLDKHDKGDILSMLLSSTVNKEYGKVFQDLILLDDKGFEEVHISRTEIFTDQDLTNLAHSPEFQKIMKGDEIYFGPVYFDKHSGEPLLIISLPVKEVKTHKLSGVLVGHIRMRYMWDVIANIEIGETGLAYILNDEGRVIAHPNPSVVLKETYLSLDDRSTISRGINGESSVIAKEPLMLGSEKYFIVTELPVKEAFLNLRHSLLITILFTIITLLAAGLLIFLLFRKIVKPVEALIKTAHAISGGDFEQKAVSTGNDELATLADSFNFMTSTLLDSINSLEKNIEERKEIEDKLVLSLKEKEVLLKEVHHRVKNNMQVISSLLNMQMKKMHDKEDIEMIRATQLRIRSMSLIHEKLYRSESLAYVDFSSYINELVDLLAHSYRGYSSNVEIKVDVKDIVLELDVAISCGFIITELITNSLKYAFPEREKGLIAVKVGKVEDNNMEMIIKDDGIGMNPEIDIRNTDSVGLGLVTMFSELQLGGKIILNRDHGTEYKIIFKNRGR